MPDFSQKSIVYSHRPIPPESIDKYRHELSLTADEALLYETILTLGPMPASQLALALDILPNAVYRLANSLVARKFAVVRKAWPRLFEAVPIAVALQQVEQNNTNDEARMWRGLVDVTADLPQLPDVTQVEILIGRQSLYDRYAEEAVKTKNEILVFSIGIAYSERLRETQQTVRARGVEVRHIVQRHTTKNYHVIKKWLRLGIKMRYFPAPLGFHLMIFDSKMALISLSNPSDTDQRTSMVLHNGAAIQAMREYFYSIWAQSKMLD